MLRLAILAVFLIPSSAAAMTAVEGRWVALVTDAGEIAVVDLESGLRREWAPPAPGVSALAFDPGAGDEFAGNGAGDEPPGLLLATPGTPGALFVVRAGSGEVLEKRSISIEAAFILPAPGAHRAYVAGKHGDRWAALSVSFDPAAPDEGPVALPGPVLGAAMSRDGSRLLFSFDETIRSFSTQPFRSSWQLRSPGPNRALLSLRARGEFIAARGRQLAIFDPATPPVRDPVTGAFPSDDAVRVIPLPFPAGSVAAGADGRLASVLSGDGTLMAIVDQLEASIVEIRQITATDAVVFRTSADGVSLVAHGGGSVTRLAIALPRPTAPATAPPPTPPVSTSAAVGASAATVEPTAVPASSAEAPPPDAGSRTEPSETPIDTPSRSEPPGPPATEAPSPAASSTPAPSSTPAASTTPASPGMIRGRITGDVALVQAVVLYGPNSIFKEFARVAPEAGGFFSAAIPPPGRYRIVLVGAGGAQLSYSPPYYQIAIGGEGIGGLDFSVTGRIPGTLGH